MWKLQTLQNISHISRKHCSDNTKCSSVGCVMISPGPGPEVSAIMWLCKVFIGRVQKITSTSVWILLKATAVREDHSVVSLRVHTNIHSGLTKIVSVRPVKERPVIDVFIDYRKKFPVISMVSDNLKSGRFCGKFCGIISFNFKFFCRKQLCKLSSLQYLLHQKIKNTCLNCFFFQQWIS